MPENSETKELVSARTCFSALERFICRLFALSTRVYFYVGIEKMEQNDKMYRFNFALERQYLMRNKGVRFCSSVHDSVGVS